MTILKHLFAPIDIGRMKAKNRLLMSAMSINFGVDDSGYVTEQLTAYFEERARGGTGLVLRGANPRAYHASCVFQGGEGVWYDGYDTMVCKVL